MKLTQSFWQAGLAGAVAFCLKTAKVAALSNPAVGAVALAVFAVRASTEKVTDLSKHIPLLCQKNVVAKEAVKYAEGDSEVTIEGSKVNVGDVKEPAEMKVADVVAKRPLNHLGKIVTFAASVAIAYAVLQLAAFGLATAAVSSMAYAAGGIALGSAALSAAATKAPETVARFVG